MDVFQVSPPVALSSSATNLCNRTLMEYSFGQSYGKPFVGQYQPPSCEFNRVVMNFTVTSAGQQFDRLAIMYLGDVEIWRTSTAEPTNAGIIWTYTKDSSHLMYLWKQPQKIIFDLGNNIDDTYTAPFNTTLTATFFSTSAATKPADVILPLSAKLSASGQSSAWNYPDMRALDTFTIPQNVKKLVASLSAVGQAQEEFWWSNVPSSTTQTFGNNTLLGFSPFREVQLLIDGELAGVSWPFPIIFTGGVVPGFWRPLVGIDAFDMQEDEIDLTPWLSILSDGKPHTYEIKVMGLVDDGNGSAALISCSSYWVVTGKMFLWLDPTDSITTGALINKVIHPPTFFLTAYTTKGQNGTNATLKYQVLAKRELSFTSTIHTASGPSRASWTQSLSYSNIGIFNGNGNNQTNDQITSGLEVSSNGYSRKLSYPLKVFSFIDINPATKAMTLEGRLDRGKNIQIIGEATFPTGLESYTKEGSFGGMALNTRQNASAIFKSIPAEKRAGSWGSTEQDLVFNGFRVGKAEFPQVPIATDNTQLYSRNVVAFNGTVGRDGASAVGRTMADEQFNFPIINDTDMLDDFAMVRVEDIQFGKLRPGLSFVKP
ncbi:hypothetical protein EJ08DRAFT_586601 [Tothia fuscella]|uniref:Peptide N-acetyl-beta-D-glucosaminyl asparaginase amidase A N-terminal domain-containing protein n=1 Tax=Tothia fuscella TaxID=1048955 RepID=A0A9P4NUN0_9PEZI|nr:hypothetical protein EJ08DRAFT_586601 [Tothia fuscella]